MSIKCVQFVKLKEIEMHRISLLLSPRFFPFLQKSEFFSKNVSNLFFLAHYAFFLIFKIFCFEHKLQNSNKCIIFNI